MNILADALKSAQLGSSATCITEQLLIKKVSSLITMPSFYKFVSLDSTSPKFLMVVDGLPSDLVLLVLNSNSIRLLVSTSFVMSARNSFSVTRHRSVCTVAITQVQHANIAEVRVVVEVVVQQTITDPKLWETKLVEPIGYPIPPLGGTVDYRDA